MSWYDWLNPIEQTTSTIDVGKDVWNGITNPGGWSQTGKNPNQIADQKAAYAYDQTGQPTPWHIDDQARQELLAQQGGLAGKFADQAQQGYNAYGQQAQGALAALQRQAAGQDSVSAEQLRQALGQQLAQQRSFAAGASPRNAAGAARTAAIQMGRASAGMAGQQAVAGLQERNQANQQYGQLVGQLRGQDLSAATQSRQNAMSGYGAPNTGAQQPSWIQQYGPAIAGGIAAAASDRRLKKDVKGGDDAANKALKSLRAYTFAYKNKKYGEGKQTGVMAQDLERAGLKHAVIDTPEGKMVHGAKLATSNTAMLAALERRVAKMEGGARR